MSALAAVAGMGAVLMWLSAGRVWTERRRLVRGASVRALPSRRPRRRIGRKAVAQRRSEVTELIDALAAELAAGSVWDSAVQRAAQGVPGQLARQLAEAVDVRHALAASAGLSGAEGLLAVVAVGDLSERVGAASAALVDRVGEAVRSEDRLRRAVQVELAPALATSRLLAGLPLVGVLMGAALGSDPLHVLVGTGPGRACLIAAGLLEGCGLLWCRAIRRRAVG